MTNNKFVWTALVVAVFVAAQAQAQTVTVPAPSWTAGVDFGFGGHLTGIEPAGISVRSGNALPVDQSRDPFVSAHLGLKPIEGWGGEVRFSSFGGGASSNGSLAVTDGALTTWGVDATPHIVSTAPILAGPVAYSATSSAKFSRFDFLVNRNFAFDRAWVSVFGGVPILRTESTEAVSRSQHFLLYAKLSNGNLDTVGNREDYAYVSTATSTSTKVGLMGGVEGEVCPTPHLIVSGRLSVATFPWGTAQTTGSFTALKDIYLVTVAGGVNGNPTSTLAHLTLPGSNYAEDVKQTTTALDGQIGIKWRFKGQSATFDIGLALAGSVLDNAPLAPDYTITDGFAPGNGKFSARPSASISTVTPMITVGIWFGK